MDAKAPLKFVAVCTFICGAGLFVLIQALSGLANLGVIDNEGAGGIIMIASIVGIPLTGILLGLTLILAIVHVVGKLMGKG